RAAVSAFMVSLSSSRAHSARPVPTLIRVQHLAQRPFDRAPDQRGLRSPCTCYAHVPNYFPGETRMLRRSRGLMLNLGVCFCLLTLLAPRRALAQSDVRQHPHEQGAAAPERLGTVRFETSCAPAVRAEFNRSVALLHSFWFSAAIDGFKGVLAHDPSCTIADWGIALSRWGN